MKRITVFFFLTLLLINACKQKNKEIAAKGDPNSLLWKVSGNGLKEPSYLYGTVHLLCSEDAILSETFRNIIKNADEIYFELDMDDVGEMMSMLGDMKMRGDTTLEDLLSENDFKKVKEYVEENDVFLPFSQLKTFLPILVSTVLAENAMPCEEKTGIEEAIQEVAEKYKKPIEGIETSAYQVGIIGSIPYAEQAKDLLTFIDSASNKDWIKKEMDKFYNAYKAQDLTKIMDVTNEMDSSIIKYADILIYKRNRNWVAELKKLMPKRSIVLAVGAGHLPGEQGVINLLKKEGYEVTPIENDISPKKK